VFLDLHNENRGRALTVLDSMPDETVRQLLLAMNFKDRYELSLPRKRQRLLESQESKPGSRAPRRGHQSADAPALNGSDPEIVAAQVDPLSASEAAQAIRQLGPELSGQVLDLLGSRKARSIRKYL
jgi:Mg/Co/Ni transporter MgtE